MTYTYADHVFLPSRHHQSGDRSHPWLYNLALILGGSLLLGLVAQIAIPLPFSPVPITGQTFGVLLIGATLGSKRGALCILTYLAEAIAGLPFFTGGASGIAALAGPTGGYLVGFVLAAYITGWLAERGWDRQLKTNLLAMVLGNIAIYALGLPWLGVLIGFDKVLALGLVPFIPGDLVKLLLAAGALPLAWRLTRRSAGGFSEKKGDRP